MNIYLLSKEVSKTIDELTLLARRKGVVAPRILFSTLEASDKLGYFDSTQNLIVLTENLLGDAAKEMRENVFLHELAHYVDYLRHHNTAHDATFRAVCNELGVDPDYSYAVVRNYIEKKQNMQKKVEKLVALSSSDFEGEAESAISKAKALMEKYNIDYTVENKEEIYGIDFHKARKIKTWETLLMSVISNLTGAFRLTQCGYNERTLSFFGSREQCEFSLYLWEHFTYHINEKYNEIKDRTYYRVHPAEIHNGIVAGIKRKVGEASKALILSQTQNEELYKRVTDARIRHTSIGTRYGSQYAAGREAGEGISIPSGMKGVVKRICG